MPVDFSLEAKFGVDQGLYWSLGPLIYFQTSLQPRVGFGIFPFVLMSSGSLLSPVPLCLCLTRLRKFKDKDPSSFSLWPLLAFLMTESTVLERVVQDCNISRCSGQRLA